MSFVLPILPHRCRACRHRFWRFTGPVLTPFRAAVLALVVLALGLGLSRFAEAVLHGDDKPRDSAAAGAGGDPAGLAPVPVPHSLSLPPGGEAPVEEAGEDDGPDAPAAGEDAGSVGSGAAPGEDEPERAATEAALRGTEAAVDPAYGPEAEAPEASPERGTRVRLEALRAVEKGEALEIRLSASRPLEGFQSLVLDNPRRFVVDLPGSWSPELPADLSLSHALARGVRLGLRGNGLRVVVDLEAGAGPNPRVDLNPEGLTIRLEPGSLRPLPP